MEIAVCVQCQRSRKIKARKLCHTCYEHQRLTPEDIIKRNKAANKRYRENRDVLVEQHRERNKKLTPETRRKWYLKQKFGITQADYELLFKRQNGKCAICDKPYPNKPLSIDHCHKTGKIRGLLCRRCNSVLSEFENMKWKKSAEKYLEGNCGF